MRWIYAAALQVLSVAGLPTAEHSSRGETNTNATAPTTTAETWAELSYFDIDTSRAILNLGSHELTSPLVLDIQLHQVEDPLISNITINGQQLNVNVLDLLTDGKSEQDSQPRRSSFGLTVVDQSGVSHSVNLGVTGSVGLRPQLTYDHVQAEPEHSLRIDITAVESHRTPWTIHLASRPLLPGGGLFKLTQGSGSSHPQDSMYDSHSLKGASAVHRPSDLLKSAQDDYDVQEEIEALILLEAQAGHMEKEIAAKKAAIAKCLKTHRDEVTLKHLLNECDGLVCAAKVVAQRICDKIGIVTEPTFQHAQIQDTPSQQRQQTQKLISFEDDSDMHDDKPAAAATLSDKSSSLPSSHTGNSTSLKSSIHYHTSAFSTLPLTKIEITPQTLLLRAFALLASILGLTALVAFLRRKFTSPRSQVDRLAAKEERRTARAYRRAARRAEMKRRWANFWSALNCFKAGNPRAGYSELHHDSGRRVEDYDEKRRLILQDAFLEQDLSLHEKGEVMEAEIRELRNASQIVSALIQNARPLRGPSRANVPETTMPWVGDAERGWVQTEMRTGRSRASTDNGTLPSYTSEVLPDYRSRYTRTLASSSVRSESVIAASSTPSSVFGLEMAADETSLVEEGAAGNGDADDHGPRSGTGSGTGSGSASRSMSPMSGTSGRSRSTDFTALSSVVDVESGYRASGDTLRTYERGC